MPRLRFLLPFLFLALLLPLSAQTPKLWLKFDGDLTDSSGAGVITTITPSATVGTAATGTAFGYTADRNGVASKALAFPLGGSASLLLQASGFSGDSLRALGLRTAGGTNTPFTLSTWMKVNSVASQGYNTVFGSNLAATTTTTGVLHAGVNTNTAYTHFGFNNSNDVTGGTTPLIAGVWYHLAFVYDPAQTTAQRIYINGVPEVTRQSATDTLVAADLLLGNFSTGTDASNDFRGSVDDVAVYNVALAGDQIQALANGVAPNALPTAGSYSPPPTTFGYRGTDGYWGVREIKGYTASGFSAPYNDLVDVDRIIKNQASVAGGTVMDYRAPVINIADPDAPSTSQYFSNKSDFATGQSGDDNSIALLARCSVRIPASGAYTFGFRGDDGSRLRVVGHPFSSSTRVNASNPANPGHSGDAIYYPAGTGDSLTLGVVTLPAGDYALEFTYFENTGGAGVEVFASPGSKTAFDSSTFQLIGNTTAGGLQIVRDANIVPNFSVAAGDSAGTASSIFIQTATAPAHITLAWSVADTSTSLSIDQGIGAVASSGTLTLNTPTISKTYTMTATNGTDVFTKTVTVLVDQAPTAALTANRTSVTAGSAVTLSWTTAGESSLTLNPGAINVTGLTSYVVTPSATTTYTLVATNASGSTSPSLTVTVGLPPTINSFTTNNANPVYGKNTSLSWNITNSTTQSIDQSVGPVAGSSGTVLVVPLLTTTYTITATNAFGSSTAAVTITLPTPMGVTAAGFTVRRVSSTVAFPYNNFGYLDSALQLLGLYVPAGATSPNAAINVSSSTTQAGVTTLNYTSAGAFPGAPSTNFAVQITGTLIVNTPGDYTFVMNCDNGCRLRIDGVDVEVDDSNHNVGEVTGKVTLTKPTAAFELVYYHPVNYTATMQVYWLKPNLTLQTLGVVSATAPVVRNGVVINEFCASNSSSLYDEDGDDSDWIEIWNSTAASVNLTGYYLSNVAGTPAQWALPARTLAANQYLVVFASSKNRTGLTGNLHTNFNLAASGGYLALKKDDGAGGYTTLSEYNPYPAQKNDITYGPSGGALGTIGFMDVPTPGNPNAGAYLGLTSPVVFSRPRGLQTAAFNLTLTPGTAGATIRYTTDGSEPSFSTGTIYAGPIAISGTTVVRASNFLDGWEAPVTVTNSYLFPADIINQTAAYCTNRGWPSTSVNTQVYRYGLALANVTAGGGNAAALQATLSAAPSVCLNLKPDDFFSAATGIYSNPQQYGRAWERAASLEIINTDNTTTVQNNCGVRVRGNASRTPSNPKHGFHIYFRGQYGGSGKLNFPIFGSEGTLNTFDQIDMRCEENNSWSKDNSTLNALVREEFSRKSQGDMGQTYSRNSYFHLYINGIYWGVFDWEEKTEADFATSIFGGDDTQYGMQYDTVKSAGTAGGYNTECTDGNFVAWQKTFDLALALKNASTEAQRTAYYYQLLGLNPDGTRNVAYPILLNTANLVDYLLVVYFDGSFDSPMSTFLTNASNNWFGFRRHDSGMGGWQFFCHDHEHGMGTANQSYNRVGPWGDPNATGNNWGQTWTTGQYRSRETFLKFNPHYLHEFLCYSAEYRQAFNDRVHKHFFGSGAMTSANVATRINNLATQVDPIIHAEAARWGSTSLNKSTWTSAKNAVLAFNTGGGTPNTGETNLSSLATSDFGTTNRTTIILEQLKGYTDNGAKPLLFGPTNPVFSGQAGGLVAPGYSFTITNPNSSGVLYYTKDGSDPRAIGGAPGATALTGSSPVSIALNASSTIRARIYDTATALWSGDTSQIYVVGVTATASNIVISKLNYNPANSNGEYVEFMNISAQTVVMTGVRFTNGIVFQFPDNYTIPPGGRSLVVQDSVANFQLLYPSVTSAMIAGQYTSGKLDNSGEQVTVMPATGTVPIKDFTYGIAAPWPAVVAAGGPCLVLIKPETNPDPTVASNWRASVNAAGAPGADDTVRFSTWLSGNGITNLTGLGDKDFDGLSDLLEYALGLNPSVMNGSVGTTGTVTVGGVDYLSLTFSHLVGLDDLSSVKAEACTTLTDWADAVLVSATRSPDGTRETLVYRHPHARTADPSQFMRVKVTK